ncbi:MAG TPA: hypothetical protein VGR29_01095 [Thermomicrobiales bacterium]|jgi:hypothetical protein|nr:hypothetical protein [Thermomicrobiales bacterium]
MELLEGLIRAVLTVGFVVLVILAIAALFMLVFTLATSFDKRVHR